MTALLQFRDGHAATSGFGIERVARRPDGADEVGLAAFVQCLAKPTNVNVDGSKVDVRVVAPNRVQKTFPRKHAPRVLEEMLQQAKLGRAERYRIAVAAHPTPRTDHCG